MASSRHLVIFVHGFNGAATGTWMQFPDRIMTNPIFAGSDVVYYGYDGVFQQAQDSGGQFYLFANQLIANPLAVVPEKIRPFLNRPPAFSYDRITLVAHSLGAVVVRLALLDAHKNKRPWLASSEIILYAPAHMGSSNIPELVSQALLGIPYLKWVGGAVTFKLKVLRDLKEESGLLKSLQDRTKAALADAPELRARAIVVTSKDDAVKNNYFLTDPTPSRMDTATHVTICKPDPQFEAPAKFLDKQMLWLATLPKKTNPTP
jgi:hypothetical protein